MGNADNVVLTRGSFVHTRHGAPVAQVGVLLRQRKLAHGYEILEVRDADMNMKAFYVIK